MRWYQELQQASCQATLTVIEQARLCVLSDFHQANLNFDEIDGGNLNFDEVDLPPSSPAASSSPSIVSSPRYPSSPVADAEDYDHQDELPLPTSLMSSPPPLPSHTSSPPSEGQSGQPSQPRTRPSEYLRRRCLLCLRGQWVHDPNAMYVYLSFFS